VRKRKFRIRNRGIDLSVGAVMALAAAILPLYLGYGWPVAVLMAMLVGVLCGVLNGTLVAVVGVQPIVATLALLVGGRGLALVLADGQAKQILDQGLIGFGSDRVLGIPKTVILAAVLVVLVGVVVRRTTFGRHLLAVGGNPRASRLAGLPVKRTLIGVYVISGVLAAIAGVVITARLNYSDPSSVGTLVELSAITAVVVGGTPLSGGRVACSARWPARCSCSCWEPPSTSSTCPTRRRASSRRSSSSWPSAPALGEDHMTATSAAPVEATQSGVGTGRGAHVAELLQRNGALLVLVLVCLVASLAFDTFATTSNLRNVAVQSSFLALVAFGMTFVILTGGIDLSVGSVYALGGVLVAYGAQYGTLVGLLLPIGACALIGLVQGLVISRGGLPPFIVTLAGLLAVRGSCSSSPTRAPGAHHPRGAAAHPRPRHPARPAVLGVDRRGRLHRAGRRAGPTGFGQSLYAIGGRGDAARLMGLPVARSTTLVYVLSATLAGAAGALLAARSSSGVPIVGVG
jgi:ribose/xylose/arabinose/galactoside ABC-type transport system permease subunit